jgi:hypothetical protein
LILGSTTALHFKAGWFRCVGSIAREVAFRQARRYFPTMSYTGTVEGGVVKLPSEAAWPDGTRVRIEPLESQADGRHKFASADLVGSVDGDGVPATNERVRKVMGCRR